MSFGTRRAGAPARWGRRDGGGAAEPVFLAAPGDVIWQLIKTPRTVQELADELRRRFAGDPATIVRDVEAFVAELAAAGLVER